MRPVLAHFAVRASSYLQNPYEPTNHKAVWITRHLSEVFRPREIKASHFSFPLNLMNLIEKNPINNLPVQFNNFVICAKISMISSVVISEGKAL
jgi:hypothetical protein